MAVGMTFVIVNKDLDLSVGSLYGLTAAVFSVASRRPISTAASASAIFWARRRRAARRADQRRAGHLAARAGLHRHADDALHRTRLRHRPLRRQDHLLHREGQGIPGFFFIGENNAWGFNNQVFILLDLRDRRHDPARQDAQRLPDLRHRRQRARRRPIPASPTHWVRMRAYLLSALLRDGRRHHAGRAGQGR